MKQDKRNPAGDVHWDDEYNHGIGVDGNIINSVIDDR